MRHSSSWLFACHSTPPHVQTHQKSPQTSTRGNLCIGDPWNAITIIALSRSNPLKAVAEFVENSIDTCAKTIIITGGKNKAQHYLRVKDDGEDGRVYRWQGGSGQSKMRSYPS